MHKSIYRLLKVLIISISILVLNTHLVTTRSDDPDFELQSNGNQDGNWPMFHYGNRNRGYSRFETTVEVLTEPRLLWSYSLPNTVYGSPVVADVDRDGKKEIFIDNSPVGEGTSGGRLVCLNESGQLIWAYQPYQEPGYGGWSYSTPAIADIDQNGFDEILYSSKSRYWYDYHQELYCLEPNGTRRWSKPLQAQGIFGVAADVSMPTIANVSIDQQLEVVFQYQGREELYLYSFAGARMWMYDYGWMAAGAIATHVAPAVGDLNNDGVPEIVTAAVWYWDYFNGSVFCVDSAGNLLWSRHDIRPQYYYDGYRCSSPVIDDLNSDGFQEVLVGGFDGVHCLNQSGDTLWFYNITTGVFNTVAVADINNDSLKEIVFGTDNNWIHCVNSTGDLMWKYPVGGAVWSSPTIADIEKRPDGVLGQLEIVVGSLDGKLYCLNSSGGLVWTYNAGASIHSSPAIVDLQYSGVGTPEIIFAASNKLYALRITPAHDVAITSVSPHKSTVGQGYNLPINVNVKNRGDYSETFNVTLYANEAEIQTKLITNLNPYASTVLSFKWNTTETPIGAYIITAVADSVPEEYHTIDNTLVDGSVTIESSVHDVAVTNVVPSKLLIGQGTHIDIHVTIQNQGNMKETFEVTVFANGIEIQTKTVTDMDSGTTWILGFAWDTTSSSPGSYVISANASIVPGETQTEDNTYIDGTVSITEETCVYVYPPKMWVQPNETFAIDAKISYVIDLYAWQIKLHFDPTILDFISASGGMVSSGYGFVIVGDYGSPFTGSRTLCQITFKAKTEGISHLNFSRPFPDDTFLWDSYLDYIPFDVVDGSVKVVQHEIIVTSVTPSKAVVCQGYSARIEAIIENKGYYTESFNVTAYANVTEIDSEETTLASGNSTSITFTWNTTGFVKGNYTMIVIADVVPDEVDPTDNSYTDGWIIVAMVGDITGPDGYPDGKCDIRDVALVALHFGEDVPPAPPNCDVTGPTTGVPDGKIDIRDIATVALHFGEIDP